jgi:hypothetical protein
VKRVKDNKKQIAASGSFFGFLCKTDGLLITKDVEVFV